VGILWIIIKFEKNLLVHGIFKQRYNSDQFEFKITGICLLETAKQMLTKHLEIKMEPASLSNEFVHFLEKNIKSNPGKSSLRFSILEPTENLEVKLYSLEKGFTMNEEMADFLLDNPDVEVSVGLVN
jgi:DNA polymerase-3 subunit alpha